MLSLRVALPCVLLLAPAVAAHAQGAVLAASVNAPNAADNGMVLEPGDMLRLKIWREPDFSGDYLVDEHGMAVLPRLGETAVTGVPTEELKTRLLERYREYLNNPSIEITPLHRVAIIGAVHSPGVYRIEPSTTLGEVVNVAGGATPQSKRNIVELRRGTGHQTIDLGKHPELATLPLASNDQIYVPERSWLSQNATWFVSTLVGIGGTAAYLITR